MSLEGIEDMAMLVAAAEGVTMGRFRNQSSWSSDARAVGKFIEYAAAIGMDQDAFEACVDSDEHADVVTPSSTSRMPWGCPARHRS